MAKSQADGVLVSHMEPDSAFAGLPGFEVGSRLIAIDGQPVRDEIDLLFLVDAGDLEVQYLTPFGERRIASLSLALGDPAGFEIEPLRPRRCRNRCVFCFVDQNPPGLRPPLYVKDEDFRLSFAHGHYITGSSLTNDDIERIDQQRLSPLYLSVHATEHVLRCRLLGIDPGRTVPVLDLIGDLELRGIDMHTQIVLCPGWNDGAALDRTLDDLQRCRPGVLSVAIVPVGLTASRQNLCALDPVTPELARDIIDRVAPRQRESLARTGEHFVMLSDEFYLLADREPPVYGEDELDYQIENGVGMMQRFRESWERRAPRRLRRLAARGRRATPLGVALLTGALGARVLEPLAGALTATGALDVRVFALANSLFGEPVTVAGLLPGAAFDRAVGGLDDAVNLVLLPAAALRSADSAAEGDAVFLDDLPLGELRRRHPRFTIEPVGNSALAILDACERALER